MRIGSNARIPGYSHCEDRGYCSYFSKKIEMVKISIPNFCINFLNKTVKSLSILCDFAVASFGGAWIKILDDADANKGTFVASFGGGRGLKCTAGQQILKAKRRILRGGVD